MFEELPALARSDARNDLCAVVERELGVLAAEGARDALNKDLGLRSDENGHW